MEFAVMLIASDSNSGLIRESLAYCCPPTAVSGGIHGGTAPVTQSFITNVAGAVVSSVKMAEDDDKTMLLRLYDADGWDGAVQLTFIRPVAYAAALDINENNAGGTVTVDGNTVRADLRSYSILTVAVRFDSK